MNPIKHNIYDVGNIRVQFVSTAIPTHRWQCLNKTNNSVKAFDRFDDCMEEAFKSCGNSDAIEVKSIPLPVFAGTSIITTYDNHVLVGLRGSGCGHGRGMWSFPGGKLDYGVDTDTAAASEREFLEETGRPCRIKNASAFHPELFTTNCFMEADSVHYITLYHHAFTTWGADIKEEIVGKEPTKCEKWVWKSIKQLVNILLERPEDIPVVGNDIVTMERTKTRELQWMPIMDLIRFGDDLRLRP